MLSGTRLVCGPLEKRWVRQSEERRVANVMVRVKSDREDQEQNRGMDGHLKGGLHGARRDRIRDAGAYRGHSPDV
eukprot:6203128-Pleurochrysis_carterae.AAC.2